MPSCLTSCFRACFPPRQPDSLADVSRKLGLSQQAPGAELRSSDGEKLRVKRQVAVFTGSQSRFNHRESANRAVRAAFEESVGRITHAYKEANPFDAEGQRRIDDQSNSVWNDLFPVFKDGIINFDNFGSGGAWENPTVTVQQFRTLRERVAAIPEQLQALSQTEKAQQPETVQLNFHAAPAQSPSPSESKMQSARPHHSPNW